MEDSLDKRPHATEGYLGIFVLYTKSNLDATDALVTISIVLAKLTC